MTLLEMMAQVLGAATNSTVEFDHHSHDQNFIFCFRDDAGRFYGFVQEICLTCAAKGYWRLRDARFDN